MANIDRSSPIPIHHQLKTLIQEQIEGRVWLPGERIPTEQELCRLYDISRSPVRQALNELARDGLLVRRPGLGTFVTDRASAEPAPDISIRVMSSDPQWSGVFNQVARVWNAEHTSQRITFNVNVVDHSQFYRLLRSEVGGGTAPDVAMVDSVWVAGLAQSGSLYALKDPALGAGWNRAEFTKDLYAAFVKANSFDGKLYGLPFKADASLLWFRKDWFAQEALQPPRNWEELVTVAGHFRQPQVRERYGISYPLAFPGGGAAGEATVYNLMPFVWSAGGEIFDARVERVILDAAGTRRAVQFVRELVTRYHVGSPEIVNYRWDTAPWLFANGKVAMALGGSYESDSIRQMGGWGYEEFVQRVDCVSPPAAPGGKSVSTTGGISYVILRQCRRPELVMDVLKLAVRPDVVGDMYRSMLQSSPFLSFSTILGSDANPLCAKVPQMVASGRARPSIPEYFKVSRQLQAMFEAAISSSTPIDEIVHRTAEFIGVIRGRDLGYAE